MCSEPRYLPLALRQPVGAFAEAVLPRFGLRRVSFGIIDEIDPMLLVNLDDASHIRPASLCELLGAAREEVFKARWSRKNPMFAGRGAIITVRMDTATRKVYCTPNPHLGPLSRYKITDTPLDHQKKFILVMMDMERRTTTRRCRIKHHSEPATGLLAAEHDGKHITKCVKVPTGTGLHND
jgi:hypothetical protein